MTEHLRKTNTLLTNGYLFRWYIGFILGFHNKMHKVSNTDFLPGFPWVSVAAIFKNGLCEFVIIQQCSSGLLDCRISSPMIKSSSHNATTVPLQWFEVLAIGHNPETQQKIQNKR